MLNESSIPDGVSRHEQRANQHRAEATQHELLASQHRGEARQHELLWESRGEERRERRWWSGATPADFQSVFTTQPATLTRQPSTDLIILIFGWNWTGLLTATPGIYIWQAGANTGRGLYEKPTMFNNTFLTTVWLHFTYVITANYSCQQFQFSLTKV